MRLKEELCNSLVKTGYAKSDGKKIWDIAERRFLYMTPDLAKGFLNIRKFPIYRKQIVDREVALIHAHSPTFVNSLGDEPINLIDIYCGDGKKAVEFVKALQGKVKIRYCPVNVTPFLTDLATQNMKKAGFKNVVSYSPMTSDGDAHVIKNKIEKLRDGKFRKNVILIFGSVLASYEINNYLFELKRVMKKGDMLIIGNGVRKGKRLVNLQVYKHDIWNDWFIHLMEGLGFSRDELVYDARFNTVRVELFYKLKKNKELFYGKKKFSFKKGDEILVAIMYKYFAEELDKFCSMYFSDVKLALDKDEEYALAICKK